MKGLLEEGSHEMLSFLGILKEAIKRQKLRLLHIAGSALMLLLVSRASHGSNIYSTLKSSFL